MKKILIALALPILLCQCEPTSNISSTAVAGSDFSTYKTYDFLDFDIKGLPESRYTKAMDIIKTAITEEMNRRGFTQSSDNPDLKFNIGVQVEEKAQTREANIRTDGPRYAGQRNYSWQANDIVVGYYKEGLLAIDLVDSKQNKLVWNGKGSIIGQEKTEKNEKAARALVNEIFEKFPVKPKAA